LTNEKEELKENHKSNITSKPDIAEIRAKSNDDHVNDEQTY
jgi:hypothetical protein